MAKCILEFKREYFENKIPHFEELSAEEKLKVVKKEYERLSGVLSKDNIKTIITDPEFILVHDLYDDDMVFLIPPFEIIESQARNYSKVYGDDDSYDLAAKRGYETGALWMKKFIFEKCYEGPKGIDYEHYVPDPLRKILNDSDGFNEIMLKSISKTFAFKMKDIKEIYNTTRSYDILIRTIVISLEMHMDWREVMKCL